MFHSAIHGECLSNTNQSATYHTCELTATITGASNSICGETIGAPVIYKGVLCADDLHIRWDTIPCIKRPNLTVNAYSSKYFGYCGVTPSGVEVMFPLTIGPNEPVVVTRSSGCPVTASEHTEGTSGTEPASGAGSLTGPAGSPAYHGGTGSIPHTGVDNLLPGLSEPYPSEPETAPPTPPTPTAEPEPTLPVEHNPFLYQGAPGGGNVVAPKKYIILNTDGITNDMDPPMEYGNGQDKGRSKTTIHIRPYQEITTSKEMSTDNNVLGQGVQAAVDAQESHTQTSAMLRAQCREKLCNFPHDY